MVVTLEEAKLYLRVEGDEENTLITHLIGTAEELCEGILRYSLSELLEVPEAVRQSILYAVANLYELRESLDTKKLIEIMTRLLFAYRQEGW